jgi:hypothetical protein
MTRHFTTARNYWPRQLERHVRNAGFSVEEVDFFSGFGTISGVAARSSCLVSAALSTPGSYTGGTGFGISTMVVGIKPITNGEADAYPLSGVLSDAR